MHSFRDIAAGALDIAALDVARSALQSLRGTPMFIPPLLPRTVESLAGEPNGERARLLACLLCAACAAQGAAHDAEPQDAPSWKAVEDIVDAWFIGPPTGAGNALSRIIALDNGDPR